jgi:hypothetical protein
MRGSAKTQKTFALGQFQRRVRDLLVNLRSEIRSKQAVLRRLKEEESKLSALTGRGGSYGAEPAPRGGGTGGARARIDWRSVLERLPKRFRASDIRTVRGLKNKRSSEIFAAITRWIESGAVKRKDRGLYKRVG